MRVDFNFKSVFDSAQKALNAVEKDAVNIAHRRAMKRTLVHLKAQTVKEMAARYQIKNKDIKGRVKTKMNYQTGDGVLWVGLNAVELYKLKNPMQTAYGAEAGGYKTPGAFRAVIHGRPSFWQRAGKNRTPISMVKVDILNTNGNISTNANTKGGGENSYIRKIVKANAYKKYAVNFDHEFRREMLKRVSK